MRSGSLTEACFRRDGFGLSKEVKDVCNAECIKFVEQALGQDDVKGREILEVGAYDVNGSVRPYLEGFAPASYLGVDLSEGPGVDLLCDAVDLVNRFGEERFDVVVSTELLEHVRDWRLVVANIKRVVRPGGLVVITTRSRGFPLHGYPHDYWRYEPEDMRVIFADCVLIRVDVDRSEPGVFLVARRPATVPFEPLDLAGYALHSVHTDRRVLEAEEGMPEEPLEMHEMGAGPDTGDSRQAEVERLMMERECLSDEVRRVAAELDALRATKTFRYTAPARRAYRRWLLRRNKGTTAEVSARVPVRRRGH